MEFPELRWAIRDVLPEGLTLFAGKPKIGKSWLALELAVGIATGGMVLGRTRVETGEVLHLALEDPPRRLQDRLRKLHGGICDSDRITFATEWERLNQGGLTGIERWMAQHQAARLVIIDTLARVRPPQRSKNHSYEEDYAALTGLKELADRLRVTVLVIHHLRKQTSEDPFDMVSGTTGLTGVVDTILVLDRLPTRTEGTLHIRGRDVEEQKLALNWNPKTCTWAILGQAEEVKQSQDRLEVMWLFEQQKRAMRIKEVAEALERPIPGTKSLLWRMGKDGLLVALGDGWYALPSNEENQRN